MGATVTQFLPLLEPGEHIEFTLPESVRRIEELVLFVDSNSYQTSIGMPLTISLGGQNPGENSTGSVQQEIRLGEWQLGYREFVASTPEPTALEFSRLNYRVQGNAPIVLDIRLSGDARTSLLLLGSTAFDPHRVANFTAESIARKPGLAGMQLAVQTRYTKENRLKDIAVVAGILMLVAAGCFMARGTTESTSSLTCWALFLAFGAFLLPLAELAWHARLDEYWNYFWPDNYVGIAYQIDRWFGGVTSWSQFTNWLAADRNGQAWLYPLIVALLSQLDMAWLDVFTMANILLAFLMLYCWWKLLRAYITDVRVVFSALLLIACHHLHIQAMLTPMTDIAGATAVAVFFLALHHLLKGDSSEFWRRFLAVGAVAVSIALGLQTRIALLPLVLVPAGLSLVLICRARQLQGQQLALLSASFLGLLLVMACYYALDLSGSLFDAANTATDNSFSGLFSYREFALYSLVNLGLPFLICVFHWRKALEEPIVLAVGLFAVAYLLMLVLGQIVTWERYWVPLMGPAVFAMAVCLAKGGFLRKPGLAIAMLLLALMAELTVYQFSGF
ncbi:MAG: hypothetical protein HOM55_04860 [Proteobacteria bacterium]|nr:hypothetical protein [Pseudomonadota bacterium]